jgi:hypothetical protein
MGCGMGVYSCVVLIATGGAPHFVDHVSTFRGSALAWGGP